MAEIIMKDNEEKLSWFLVSVCKVAEICEKKLNKELHKIHPKAMGWGWDGSLKDFSFFEYHSVEEPIEDYNTFIFTFERYLGCGETDHKEIEIPFSAFKNIEEWKKTFLSKDK
jgi:hypothetical protein